MEKKTVEVSETDCPTITPEDNSQTASGFFEQIEAFKRTWVSTGDKAKKRESELQAVIDFLKSMVSEQGQELDKTKKQAGDAEARIKELEENLQGIAEELQAAEEQCMTSTRKLNKTETTLRETEDSRHHWINESHKASIKVRDVKFKLGVEEEEHQETKRTLADTEKLQTVTVEITSTKENLDKPRTVRDDAQAVTAQYRDVWRKVNALRAKRKAAQKDQEAATCELHAVFGTFE